MPEGHRAATRLLSPTARTIVSGPREGAVLCLEVMRAPGDPSRLGIPTGGFFLV